MSRSPVKVVVVGGSYGGVGFISNYFKEAKKLQRPVEITLIDRRDYRHNCLGSFRALVQPDFSTALWAPYTSLFPQGQGHKVVQGSLKEVHHHHIVLESGDSVAFDYLVLATGSYNPAPAKIQGITSYKQAVALNQQYHKAVQAARHITVVGAGACGVELAGEIAHAFPDKKLTVIHAGARPVDYPGFADEFKAAAAKHLRDLGIDLVLNERVSVEGLDMEHPVLEGRRQIQLKGQQRTIETDLVFLSTGYVVDTSYMRTLVPENKAGDYPDFDPSSLVDQRTHRIKANAHMQIDHPAFAHIFTIGDCSNAYETATAASCTYASPILAKNVIKLIQDEKGSPSLLTKPDLPKVMLLATGPRNGVAMLPIFGTRFGNFFARMLKSKDLFSKMMWQSMNLETPRV
ncbi:hypothetical protein DFQ26_005902 [Actinomortierella ambigua]|nr:hypothetical protein DFQ26_005902 [Actinomortierella ambigua]